MSQSYDAIIIGAGHNGLVTAAYLAKKGYKPLVLERREVLGGCCVTEEVWPGYKVSTAAYVNSLLRPEIIRDLELKKHGFEMLPRSPSSFSPYPDGRYLMMGPDKDLTHREVSKFSAKDADALPKYEAMLTRVADFLEPMLAQTPPDPWSGRIGDMWNLGKLAWKFKRLGKDGAEAIEILTGAATPILDRWFESEQLKVTLATDAVIGVQASPSMPGTAYVLFHHVMGECNGVRGVWGYVRVGMGHRIRGEELRRRDFDQVRRFANYRQGRPGRRRRAQGWSNLHIPARGFLCRLQRNLLQVDGSQDSANGFRREHQGHRLLQRHHQDQRLPQRAAELQGAAGRRTRAATSRYCPYLPRFRLPGARLRRFEIWPAVGVADIGMHDGDRRR